VIIEIGHFALVLALAVAAYQTIVPQWGAWRNDGPLMASGRVAALLQVLLIGLVVCRADPRLPDIRFLGDERRRELPF
jgi:cytochrome c-type biogenesis protein CcmF